MLIYELLSIIVILWICVVLINKDIFSPSSVLCLSYIFALLCAIYNIDNWKINLHVNTFWIILIGISSFLLTSFLYIILHKGKKELNIVKKMEYVEIRKYKLQLMDLVSLLIFVIYTFYFIKAIGGISELSNLSAAMKIYRSKTMFYHMVLIPSWINFLIKFCRAVCYIYTYVLINNAIINKNLLDKKKQKNKYLYVLGILLYLPLTLMSGGRYDLIVYILYIISIYNILYIIENKKRLQFKKFIKIGLILILVLFSFSRYKGLFGRSSDSSAIDYITEYFGGSIEIFDIYMQEEHYKSDFFGQESFAGIRKLLAQIKIIDSQQDRVGTMEFKTLYNNKVLGNVYTGFRKPYHDFGTLGVVLLQAIQAIIFNKMYFDCFLKNDKFSISFNIILTGTLFFCLALHSFSEVFYSTVLSFNYVAFFAMTYFLIYFFSKVELRWK